MRLTTSNTSAVRWVLGVAALTVLIGTVLTRLGTADDSPAFWCRSPEAKHGIVRFADARCFPSKSECSGAYDLEKFSCRRQPVASCYRLTHFSRHPGDESGEWDECFPAVGACSACRSTIPRGDSFTGDCRTIEVDQFVPYPWPYTVRRGPNGELTATPREPERP